MSYEEAKKLELETFRFGKHGHTPNKTKMNAVLFLNNDNRVVIPFDLITIETNTDKNTNQISFMYCESMSGKFKGNFTTNLKIYRPEGIKSPYIIIEQGDIY